MVVVGDVMLGHYGNMLSLIGRGRIAIHWGLDNPMLFKSTSSKMLLQSEWFMQLRICPFNNHFS